MAEHIPAAVAVEAAPVVIPQGATWSLGWSYCEGDPLGVPSGWPGSWTARLEVRTKRGGDIVLRLHSSDGAADGTLTLGSEADVTVTLPDGSTTTATVATVQAALAATATEDNAFTEKEYPFDLELSNGTRVIRLVEGTAVLSREVTTGA